MIWWIAQTACSCALLAAIVGIVGRAGRLSPAVKHAMWLLVLVKLMTPPLAFYPLPAAAEKAMAGWATSLMRGERRSPQVAEPAAAASPIDRALSAEDLGSADRSQMDGELRVDLSSRADSGEAAPGAVWAVDSVEAPATEAELTESSDDLGDLVASLQPHTEVIWVLATVWLLGAVPLAVVQSMRIVRLRRLLAAPTPVPAWLEGMVQQVAAQLNVRPPRVVVIPALCSPLVCALGRPRLLWPEALGDQLPHDSRKAVLMHELAHLRRRDHWVAWLELAAGVVWWFNPLYWYVRYQLRENAELACDAWVVGLLPAGRRAYAQALIEVTEFVSLAPAAMPAVAMGNVARRTLERRLTMIMRERISYRVPLVGTALIGLSLLAVLPGWSGGQDSLPPLDNPAGEKGAKSLPERGDDSSALPPTAADVAFPIVPKVDQQSTPAVAVGGEDVYALPVGTTNAPLGGTIADPDERIRQLEAQLTQLQNAVQALREARPVIQAQNPAEPQKPLETRVFSSNKPSAGPTYIKYLAQDVFAKQGWSRDGRPSYDVETLTRARYKLSEATANALASFVKEHVKSDVEVRVAGETLTVIASQEDQMKMGAFIELLHESYPAITVPGDAQKNNLNSSPDNVPSKPDTLPARR
ncbi:MAG TPA: M56 family metallopeptidase [Pirellulales bacterium]|nr:M56 family metallopeptidase [Pirellulales bacterium]